MPTIRRSALRRRSFTVAGPAALSPGPCRDESAGRNDRARREDEPGRKLPPRVEAEPEPDHEEEEPDDAAEPAAHRPARPASARTACRARSTAVHAESPASTTTAVASTTCRGRPPAPQPRCTARSDIHAPKPRIT